MTRKTLIEEFSLSNEFETKAAAERALDTLLDILTKELCKPDGEVHLGQRFGTFYVATQAARSGEGFGVTYKTPAKQVVKFSASAPLKTLVAGN
jgi:nucleoid DNA-binding protein